MKSKIAKFYDWFFIEPVILDYVTPNLIMVYLILYIVAFIL